MADTRLLWSNNNAPSKYIRKVSKVLFESDIQKVICDAYLYYAGKYTYVATRIYIRIARGHEWSPLAGASAIMDYSVTVQVGDTEHKAEKTLSNVTIHDFTTNSTPIPDDTNSVLLLSANGPIFNYTNASSNITINVKKCILDFRLYQSTLYGIGSVVYPDDVNVSNISTSLSIATSYNVANWLGTFTSNEGNNNRKDMVKVGYKSYNSTVLDTITVTDPGPINGVRTSSNFSIWNGSQNLNTGAPDSWTWAVNNTSVLLENYLYANNYNINFVTATGTPPAQNTYSVLYGNNFAAPAAWNGLANEFLGWTVEYEIDNVTVDINDHWNYVVRDVERSVSQTNKSKYTLLLKNMRLDKGPSNRSSKVLIGLITWDSEKRSGRSSDPDDFIQQYVTLDRMATEDEIEVTFDVPATDGVRSIIIYAGDSYNQSADSRLTVDKVIVKCTNCRGINTRNILKSSYGASSSVYPELLREFSYRNAYSYIVATAIFNYQIRFDISSVENPEEVIADITGEGWNFKTTSIQNNVIYCDTTTGDATQARTSAIASNNVVPELQGYKFGGWQDIAGKVWIPYNHEIVSEENAFSPFVYTSNVTLYPKWELDPDFPSTRYRGPYIPGRNPNVKSFMKQTNSPIHIVKNGVKQLL